MTWIVFVTIVVIVQEEHVDCIAYGPALVVVLFLTNKAEGCVYGFIGQV